MRKPGDHSARAYGPTQPGSPILFLHEKMRGGRICKPNGWQAAGEPVNAARLAIGCSRLRRAGATEAGQETVEDENKEN